MNPLLQNSQPSFPIFVSDTGDGANRMLAGVVTTTIIKPSGTTQDTALPLLPGKNIINVASAGSAVIISAPYRPSSIVMNLSSVTVVCFPPKGGAFYLLGVNAPINLLPNSITELVTADGNTFYALLSAIVDDYLPLSGGTMAGPITIPDNYGFFMGAAYAGMRTAPGSTWVGQTDLMQYFETFRAMSAFFSDTGNMAVVAATRDSDYTGPYPAPLAVAVLAKADKVGGNGVEAFYGTLRRYAGCGGAIGMELSMGNEGDSVVGNPYQLGNLGTTAGLWLSNGSEAAENGETINPATCAIGIVSNGLSYTPGATWNKGLVFAWKALTANAAGHRTAIAMAESHEVVWAYDGSDARGAFFRSDATTQGAGIVFNNTGFTVVTADTSEVPIFKVNNAYPFATIFGFSATPVYAGNRANGTFAAPTGVNYSDALVQLAGFGYHSGGAYTTTARALVIARGAEVWTSTNQGAMWDFMTTPTGSTAQIIAMRLQARGALNIGSTTDDGDNLLQVTGGIVGTTLKTSAYTVGTLPTAVGNGGKRVYVTDATSSTFGSVVVGGGAIVIPVFSNGTNWIIG